MLRTLIASSVALALAAGVATADPAAGMSKKEKDRQAILAMQGDYRVVFKFEETLILEPDAGESHKETSRAFETVRVLEDTPDAISLQHLLVVVGDDEDVHVVKHWRQDWRYEDRDLHVFKGDETWEPVRLNKSEAKGTWSQAVFQVDDSPRYEGYGEWVHAGGHSYWESNDTWRPLPRREKARKDDYDVLVGRNRHSITPEGWAHEQDNYKLDLDDSGNRIIAREAGLNTYTKIDDFDFAPADEYWEQTSSFWGVVRDRWASYLDKHKTIHIAPERDGDVLQRTVYAMADKFGDGEFDTQSDAEQALDEELNRFVTLAGTD